jgi:hypothetical protein
VAQVVQEAVVLEVLSQVLLELLAQPTLVVAVAVVQEMLWLALTVVQAVRVLLCCVIFLEMQHF